MPTPHAQIQARLSRTDATKVGEALIDWTPEQWVQVITEKGPWLPACCDACALTRDDVVTALFQDGWMPAQTLREIVSRLRAHEGLERYFTPGAEIMAGDPFPRLVEIWDAVKDKVPPPSPIPLIDLANGSLPDLQGALETVAGASHFLHIEEVFSHLLADDLQDRAHRNLQVARLVPALRTLLSRAGELGLLPMEACALAKTGTSQLVGRDGFPLLFPPEATARILKALAVRAPAEAAGLEVRGVRVSATDGLTFMDHLPAAPPETPAA